MGKARPKKQTNTTPDGVPVVNYEKISIVTKHQFSEIEFNVTLDALVANIRAITKLPNPKLYSDSVGYNGAIEIGWITTKLESDTEQKLRIKIEEGKLASYEKKRENEVKKAKGILEKYGITQLESE